MILLLVSRSLAASWTVDPSGSGDFTSIQDAIDASSDGDTISVADGTYTEALDFDGKDVAIASVNGSATTFLASSAPVAVTFENGESSAASFTGFTIQTSALGMSIDGADPTITDVVFDTLGSTSAAGGGATVDDGSPTFTSCTWSGTLGKIGRAHV